MKTRMFFFPTVLLALGVMLLSVACRGREETPTPPQGGTSERDLVIADASLKTMTDPGKVRIEITVRNAGAAEVAKKFIVRWYPHQKSDTVGCKMEFNGLGAKASTTQDCTYIYTEHGEMNWRAVVDPDDEVNESNENNNEQTGTITIKAAGAPVGPTPTVYGKPDLVVEVLTVTQELKDLPRTVKVYFKVRNIGTESTTKTFGVSWYSNSTQYGMGFSYAKALFPNESTEWEHTYTYSEPGEMRWRAVVDAENLIDEANENNNEKTGTITIKPGAGLAVTRVTVSANPTTYTGPCPPTRQFTFSGVITANGPADAEYSWVGYPSGALAMRREIKFSAAGSQTVTYDWAAQINTSTTLRARINVEEPNELQSDYASITVTCK